MSKKLFILGLGICLAMGLGGCQVTPEPDPNPGVIERTDTPIQLGLASISDNAPVGRATNGQVLISTSQLVGENIALYGVCELFNTGNRVWSKTDRLINNLQATVEFDAASGTHKFNYGITPAYYPASGFLNVYGLYPSHGSSCVTVTDDLTNAPQVEVSLANRFHKQHDILHGYSEQLTVAQAQQAKITFGHALAQLRIKMYRDAAVTDHPTLTKVVVRGVSKATMASIERASFTNSTNSADSLDFIAFEGSMPLSATTKETAIGLNIDSALMLLPGLASISKVTVTVDNNDFVSYVPKTWDLYQGKINTLTLKLNKFDLRMESSWAVAPWGGGQGVNEGIENNGKTIQVSAQMLDATGSGKVNYTGTAPTKADVTMMGFTHRGIAIQSITNGVFTTAPFNCGSVNDNPLYIEGLTLYDAGNKVLFSGQLNNGALASGTTLYIDQTQNGLLKKSNATGSVVGLTMTFGGFGDGTVAQPYEVHSALHLSNIDRLLGTSGANATIALNGTSTGGAKFIQTQDIDLAGSSFIGVAQSGQFFGIYDGQAHQIKNVNLHANGLSNMAVGLFGRASRSTFIPTLITRVIITSGQVRNSAGGVSTGSIVGALNGGAVVSYCLNNASIVGTCDNVGGLVGRILGDSQLISSANWGNITTNSSSVGGVVGRLGSGALFVVSDCYNRGKVEYTGTVSETAIGGLVGYLTIGTVQPTLSNCYNRGTVSLPHVLNATAAGSIAGLVSASSGSINSASKNSYWLSGSYRVAVGSDAGNNMAGKTEEKTDVELQGLAPVLGSEWKADYHPGEINGGFPILKWQ